MDHAEEFNEDPPPPRRASGPRKGGIGSGLSGRIVVAVPAALIAVFFIIQGRTDPEWLAAFVLAIGVLALHEFYTLTHEWGPARFAGFLTLAGLIAAGTWGAQFQLVLAIVIAFPVAFFVTLAVGRHTQTTAGLAVTLFGAFWIGIPLAHAVLLERLPHGEMIIINVLLGTFIGDTAAYGAGKMFGRHPLAPRLSPNKTQEGLAAGIVAAIATVWFAGLYQDWLSGPNALLLGLAIALAAPVGDLFESMVKRDIGVKDTGKAFGAHGGALDRADAALFTIVVGYYVWYSMAVF